MKLRTYKILFRLFSFLSDKSGGKSCFVRYKLFTGTLILGLLNSSVSNAQQHIATEKKPPPEIERVSCYKPSIDAFPIKIQAKVVDKDSIPIVGLTISIKNNIDPDRPYVSITDSDGNFFIETKPKNVLIFSMLGFVTREILAREIASNQLIIMQQDDSILISCYKIALNYNE